MTDAFIHSGDIRLFTTTQGPADGPTVVFANSLGSDHRLWDAVLPHLPPGLWLIRYDKRGHGQSDVPPAPYSMGQLISDAEAVCDAHKVQDAVFVGLSVGGMIAQGLAIKRLDLVRGLVLSNTAARIGTKQMWQDRITAIRQTGIAAISDGILDRWFGADFRRSPDAAFWQTMLDETPVEGYCGTCAAIAGTDFYTTTAALRLPTLGIVGSEDGSTPPDLMRETIELIPGADLQLMRRCGHLPCVEQPQAYADLLVGFLRRIGHI
jgi:3-oxoadipate enol-lactonase